MEVSLYELIGLVCLGALVGLGASLFGLGGGVLIAPILPSILNIGAKETVIVSLATVLAVVTINVLHFAKANLIVWKKAALFGPFSISGGILAAFLSSYIQPVAIRIVTGLMLLGLGLRLLINKKEGSTRLGSPFIAFMSAAGGFGSGLTGVGTGAVLSPIFLRENVVEPKKVAPTVNAILFVTTVFALITYFIKAQSGSGVSLSHLQLESVIVMGVVSQISGIYGRKWNVHMSDSLRRKVLSSVITGLGIWVLIKVVYV